ncbi:hypothetical protein [uncultured Methanobrevibacter sp.]|uniref:hypothetical protein n=1 Tax=uncultured Methanobrevibacter sp. TaxID=253161 RepID=UPI00261E50CA|nr:hypothetical protein [uncultured Methanobrevibacter sp.]
MNKYIKILILVIIISLIALCVFNNMPLRENEIKVGNTIFTLPDGYAKSNVNEFGNINITNGNNSLSISAANNNDIIKYINEYNQSANDRNYTAIFKNFTVGDVPIYKSTLLNNSRVNHYWFVDKDKVIAISTWDAENNTDDIVLKLIESKH